VIRAPSPVPFRIGTGGWVQVSLSGLRALAAPPRRAVAKLFMGDAWFSGGRLPVAMLQCITHRGDEIPACCPIPYIQLDGASGIH
jgi:hypothetical protein